MKTAGLLVGLGLGVAALFLASRKQPQGGGSSASYQGGGSGGLLSGETITLSAADASRQYGESPGTSTYSLAQSALAQGALLSGGTTLTDGSTDYFGRDLFQAWRGDGTATKKTFNWSRPGYGTVQYTYLTSGNAVVSGYVSPGGVGVSTTSSGLVSAARGTLNAAPSSSAAPNYSPAAANFSSATRGSIYVAPSAIPSAAPSAPVYSSAASSKTATSKTSANYTPAINYTPAVNYSQAPAGFGKK